VGHGVSSRLRSERLRRQHRRLRTVYSVGATDRRHSPADGGTLSISSHAQTPLVRRLTTLFHARTRSRSPYLYRCVYSGIT